MSRFHGAKESSIVRYGGGISIEGMDLAGLLRAVIERGASFRFKARGFSMSPFLMDGDVLTVSPCYGTPPTYGDIVAFVHPLTGRLVVHRIVGRKGDLFLIRGDNSTEGDGLVPQADILGRVTGVERNGRRVLLGVGAERFMIPFITKRMGFFLPLFSPIWRLVKSLMRSYNHV